MRSASSRSSSWGGPEASSRPFSRPSPRCRPTPRRTGGRIDRRFFLGLAIGLALALPARAARVEAVRVGQHAEFTRVVFELDADASHRFEVLDTALGPELRIYFEADAESRIVPSRSRLVESVTLRPEAGGALARIHLRAADVSVEELVLRNPDRIVVDLASAASGVGVRLPEGARVEPSAGDSGRAAAAGSAGERAETAGPADPVGSGEGASATGGSGAGAGAGGRASTPALGSAATASDRVVPAAPEPGSGPDSLAPDEAERFAAIVATAEEDAPSPPGAPGPAVGPVATSSPAEDDPGDGGFVPSWVLGAALVTLLFLVFLRLRGRSDQLAREAARPEWPPPGAIRREGMESEGGTAPSTHGPAVEAPSHPAERSVSAAPTAAPGEDDGPQRALPLGADPRAGLAEASADRATADTAVAGSGPSPEAAHPADAASAHDDPATPSAEPLPTVTAQAAPEDGGEALPELAVEPESEDSGDDRDDAVPATHPAGTPAPELVRRIERLEAQLAETASERDRLERQLHAHSEELRVQRAAIARTQRAVRGLVRPEAAPAKDGEPRS